MRLDPGSPGPVLFRQAVQACGACLVDGELISVAQDLVVRALVQAVVMMADVVADERVKYLHLALCLPQSYCVGATARQASIKI